MSTIGSQPYYALTAQAVAKVAALCNGQQINPKIDLTGQTTHIPPAQFQYFPATIQTSGPDGEADYDDARYWVERVYFSNTDGDSTTALAITELDTDSPYSTWVTATNLAELSVDSHGLPEGLLVHVYWEYDQSTPPVARYYFQGGFWYQDCPTSS